MLMGERWPRDEIEYPKKLIRREFIKIKIFDERKKEFQLFGKLFFYTFPFNREFAMLIVIRAVWNVRTNANLVF